MEKNSGPVEDMKAEFEKIKKQDNGEISFANFCYWAIHRSFIYLGLQKSTEA